MVTERISHSERHSGEEEVERIKKQRESIGVWMRVWTWGFTDVKTDRSVLLSSLPPAHKPD